MTLALLAGGRGRRLGGVAKGLLTLGGVPLLARQLALAPLFADALLVTNDPSPYAAFGVRTVADVVEGRGAPGGVHAALAHAATPWVLALACDMPFVTRASLEPLLEARGPGLQAVLYEVEGRPEPLLGAYHRSLAAPWGEALAANPSFRVLLQGARARLLPEEALRAVDPSLRAVVSINSPEDLQRYGLRFGPGAGSMG